MGYNSRSLGKMTAEFIAILSNVKTLTKSPDPDIFDGATMFIEYLKEYYMNYPYNGCRSSILSSVATENEFAQINAIQPKTYSHSFFRNKQEYSSASSSKSCKTSEIKEIDKEGNNKVAASFVDPETNLGGSEVAYFLYGDEMLITIIKSSYLSANIIIRDINGKHAWRISEYQILDDEWSNKLPDDDKKLLGKIIMMPKFNEKRTKEICLQENNIGNTETTPKINSVFDRIIDLTTKHLDKKMVV